MSLVVALVIGYLIGSINPAIIISKILGTDIRKHGSGNAGATNTYRTLGAGPAFTVLLCDILKGVLAVVLARILFGDSRGADVCAGLGAVMGHNFPLYFGFKGGKGVLTSLAVAFVLQPWAALIALAVGVGVIAVTKYVSFGSMVGAVVLVIASIVMAIANYEYVPALLFAIFAALLVIARHYQNILRLLSGTERKLGKSKGRSKVD